jgi:hypothetical protein
MTHSFGGWSVSPTAQLDKIVDLVITSGTIDSLHPDLHLFDLIASDASNILDFGAGIGRNTYALTSQFKSANIFAYDNPQMLEHFITYGVVKHQTHPSEITNLKVTSDWSDLKHAKFDCILATLVFQHIIEVDLMSYLGDIRNMTKRLIVSGRRFNDDMIDGNYKNTWSIMESCGYYPTNAKDINYSAEGDPNEHVTCIYDL